MADAIAVAAAAHARGAAPILFFTYVNPVDRYGSERFAREAAPAGAVGGDRSGRPARRACGVRAAAARGRPRHPVAGRADDPAANAPSASSKQLEGFVYLVSRLGVTGARREPDTGWLAALDRAPAQRTTLPIAVGFGISTPAHAAAVGAIRRRRHRRQRADRRIRRHARRRGRAQGRAVRRCAARRAPVARLNRRTAALFRRRTATLAGFAHREAHRPTQFYRAGGPS